MNMADSLQIQHLSGAVFPTLANKHSAVPKRLMRCYVVLLRLLVEGVYKVVGVAVGDGDCHRTDDARRLPRARIGYDRNRQLLGAAR